MLSPPISTSSPSETRIVIKSTMTPSRAHASTVMKLTSQSIALELSWLYTTLSALRNLEHILPSAASTPRREAWLRRCGRQRGRLKSPRCRRTLRRSRRRRQRKRQRRVARRRVCEVIPYYEYFYYSLSHKHSSSLSHTFFSLSHTHTHTHTHTVLSLYLT